MFLGLLAQGKAASNEKQRQRDQQTQAQTFQAIKFGQDRDLAQSQIDENKARTDALRNPQAKPTPPKMQLEPREDGTYLVNLDTGESKKINVPGVTKPTPGYTPKTREEYLGNLREAGAITAANKTPPEPKQPSESERRAGGLLEEMIPSAEIVKQYSPHVSGLDAMLPAPIANLANRNKPEVQKALQAAQDLVATYLYAVSGATVQASELKARAQLILPGPSDSDELKQQKRATVDHMIEAVRKIAGRAASAPPAATGGAPGDINLAAPVVKPDATAHPAHTGTKADAAAILAKYGIK